MKKIKQKPTNNKPITNKNNSTKSGNSEYFKGFEEFLNKYSLAIVSAAILFIIIMVFKDFLFFKKLFLFKDIGSDSINANYPQFYHIGKYLKSDGIPKWSFHQGMGQNVMPFCFLDPFISLLYFGSMNNFAKGLAWAEVSKIFLAGMFFYLFLKKINITSFAAITGGILYSFSGFAILGSCWNQFTGEALYLSLLLFAFEKLYQDKNYLLIPIAFALIAILQPFDLYVFSLFLLIYIIFRLIEKNETDYKKIALLFVQLAVLGIVGIAISSFFLINDVIQMINSPRVSGDASFFAKLMAKPIFGFESKDHYATLILRTFSSDLVGTGSNFKGWQNYLEAPLFYCGLFTLLLIPQLFNFLDKRKRIIYAVFMVILISPAIFPFIRYSFWLYSGDYYRIYSLFVAIGMLFIGIKSLNLILVNNKVNAISLIISSIAILVLLFYPYTTTSNIPNSKFVNQELKSIIAILIFIYSFLIYTLQFKNTKAISITIIALTIIFELTYFSNITINKRPVITNKEYNEKVGYNDFTVDALDYINKTDKSFFRINKDFSSGPAIHSSMNDAKIQGFNGSQSYTSFNQLNYVKFLQGIDVIKGSNENETRWLSGFNGLPFLQSFASIKYAVSKTTKPFLLNFNFDSVTTIGDVKILKNRFFLPLGYTYKKYITANDFAKLTQNQKMLTLYKAVIIPDSNMQNAINLKRFLISDTSKSYSWQEFANDYTALNRETLNIKEHGQNKIKGDLKLDSTKMIFFSIPFDKGWTAMVDGKKQELLQINIGFMGLILPKGLHNIELNYLPPYYNESYLISISAIVLYVALILLYIVLQIRKRKKDNRTNEQDLAI